MSTPNIYAAHGFDRSAHRRRDSAWLADRMADPATVIVPVWQSRSAVSVERQAALLAEPSHLAEFAALPWVFLGEDAGRAHFAVDLSGLDEGEALDIAQSLDPAASFQDLRTVGPTLPRVHAHLLAYARGLAHWHSRHRFCGVCGGKTEVREAGHLLVCTNESCKAEHYPRTDPATIMLVTDGPRALLGHNKRFLALPQPMYSTLAGFVEPGESLEDAVVREVREEVGVELSAVRYHSSQPWPFPQSLMLGFHADAATTAITVDPDELADARWFTADEIRNHAANGFSIPRPDSIARALINHWLERV